MKKQFEKGRRNLQEALDKSVERLNELFERTRRKATEGR